MSPRRFFAPLAAACLVLSGCETTRNEFTTRVRAQFTGPVYTTRVYPADSRTVFAAARTTAEQLGFRITRAGPAQGVIEGLSPLASDARLRGTRQYSIKVRLSPTPDGGTEAAVLFTEMIEDDFGKNPAGLGTEAALRNHPLYENYLGSLAQALAP